MGTGRLIGVDRLTALVLERRHAIEACPDYEYPPVYADSDSIHVDA